MKAVLNFDSHDKQDVSELAEKISDSQKSASCCWLWSHVSWKSAQFGIALHSICNGREGRSLSLGIKERWPLTYIKNRWSYTLTSRHVFIIWCLRECREKNFFTWYCTGWFSRKCQYCGRWWCQKLCVKKVHINKCLIMNGYQERSVWIYRYKSIVNGNKEEEIALNLILILTLKWKSLLHRNNLILFSLLLLRASCRFTKYHTANKCTNFMSLRIKN